MPGPWSRLEVELVVADYLEMLEAELKGIPYDKTAHRRRLSRSLSDRSDGSIEFKHQNITAVLLDLGYPTYIAGYKPRGNYQQLLYEVVADRVSSDRTLPELVDSDLQRRVRTPGVVNFEDVLTTPPRRMSRPGRVGDRAADRPPRIVDYIEREARHRQLGLAGEEFVVAYERERLVRLGKDHLAGKIEHVSKERGDGDGFDILSFEPTGRDRLIEVKTTLYGSEVPFFVSRNEVRVSEERADRYHLYRVYAFRDFPRMFTLLGALSRTCVLEPQSYMGTVA